MTNCRYCAAQPNPSCSKFDGYTHSNRHLIGDGNSFYRGVAGVHSSIEQKGETKAAAVIHFRYADSMPSTITQTRRTHPGIRIHVAHNNV